jgi:hypothetical protein
MKATIQPRQHWVRRLPLAQQKNLLPIDSLDPTRFVEVPRREQYAASSSMMRALSYRDAKLKHEVPCLPVLRRNIPVPLVSPFNIPRSEYATMTESDIRNVVTNIRNKAASLPFKERNAAFISEPQRLCDELPYIPKRLHKTLMETLMPSFGASKVVAANYRLFTGVPTLEYVKMMIGYQHGNDVALNIDQIPPCDRLQAVQIIADRSLYFLSIKNIIRHTDESNHHELAGILLGKRNAYSVAFAAADFTGMPQSHLADYFFSARKGAVFAACFDYFSEQVDNDHYARKLIKHGKADALASNLYNFSGLSKQIAEDLIKRDHATTVFKCRTSFVPIPTTELLEMIPERMFLSDTVYDLDKLFEYDEPAFTVYKERVAPVLDARARSEIVEIILPFYVRRRRYKGLELSMRLSGGALPFATEDKALEELSLLMSSGLWCTALDFVYCLDLADIAVEDDLRAQIIGNAQQERLLRSQRPKRKLTEAPEHLPQALSKHYVAEAIFYRLGKVHDRLRSSSQALGFRDQLSMHELEGRLEAELATTSAWTREHLVKIVSEELLGQGRYVRQPHTDAYIPHLPGMTYGPDTIKDFLAVATEEEVALFLIEAKDRFDEDLYPWREGSIDNGGKAWQGIAEAGIEAYSDMPASDRLTWVDHVVRLQHNGGNIFNKRVEHYTLRYLLEKFLNYKFEAPDLTSYLEFIDVFVLDERELELILSRVRFVEDLFAKSQISYP